MIQSSTHLSNRGIKVFKTCYSTNVQREGGKRRSEYGGWSNGSGSVEAGVDQFMMDARFVLCY